jgi:protoporphyrin/coproporphyrin ferrochelatase
MSGYVGQNNTFDHQRPDCVGVLLVNLGTPDAPTPAAVRRFLAAFLSDPRVVEAPRWLWWPVLHGFILRFRPRRSAHAYQQIWTERGSPLLLHSSALASALESELERRAGTKMPVALGMTYGTPSIDGALAALEKAGARRVVVLPLYPQYSGTTTGSVFDRVTQTLRGWRWIPELRFVNQYHDAPQYIDALAKSVQQHWQNSPKQHLVFSFHGIPKSYLLAGDPYHCQCHKTARLVAEQLGLGESEWSLSFQSRVGRGEWLSPYTEVMLLDYAKRGPKRIDVLCPGFATDCLETLEEIAIRNRAAFLSAGGEALNYIPALNADPSHVSALADIVVATSSGWVHNTAADYPARAARAIKAGADR